MTGPVPPPAAPYVGLRPYGYVDRSIFFARQRESLELARRIVVYRGVLLYGESGVGKSSLINAGLVPAILEEGFTPERLRLQPRPGREIVLERIPAGASPAGPYLPSSLLQGPEELGAARAVLAVEGFLERVRAAPPERPPLLVFDQFEELVTLFEGDGSAGGGRSGGAARAQQAILEMVDALMGESRPVKLLFAFREDYLAKLRRRFRAYPELNDHYLQLDPPETTALHQIIRGPFERHPGLFERQIGRDLANRLVDAFGRQGQVSSVNLSVVQVACLELWHAKDPEALLAERGVEGLLKDHFSAVLERLPPELGRAAIALLRRLVTSSGARNVVSREDLLDRAWREDHLPRKDLERALTALERDVRLVQSERRHDTSVYELVSEFLIPWIAEQPPAPRTTEPAIAGAPSVTATLPTMRGWRTVAAATADRLELELALNQATLMGTAERAALGVALRHIDAARAIANAPRTRWQRWRSWWTGEDADLAWANLRAAQVALIACLSPNAVRVMIPEIEAAAETYGEETPALAAFTEWSRHRPRDAPLGEADRRVLQAAVTQIDRVASVSAVRLRGFRNVLLVAWLVLTVLAVGVAILGAVAPTAVLLCGDRGQAATSTGGGGVACPSGSATPSGADVAYVELLGTVGAALAVAATLRGIRATTGTYDIAVALALLKLPVGALAALTGVVLLHGGFVPGFTAATGSATAAYAVIFGYASLLLTRLVDRQADIVVEPVDHPTPVQTLKPEPKAEPEPEPEPEPEAEAGPERRASPG